MLDIILTNGTVHDGTGGDPRQTDIGIEDGRIAAIGDLSTAEARETVDVTDADSAGRWRELLGGAGVQRAALSGAGIFKDAQSDALIRTGFFSGTIADFGLGRTMILPPDNPLPT